MDYELGNDRKPYWRRLRKASLMQWVYFFVFIALFAVGSLLFFSRIENFFVFHPQRTFDYTPEDYGLPYKDVVFESSGGKGLHGWYFPAPQNGPVILFCHGNAGNISHRLENIAGLLRSGLGVFIFDYSGYGRSEGSPSEKGIYEDGISAHEYLVRREGVPPERIVPFGRSLGGAVAIEVALEKKVRSLILECAFTSLPDMAGSMLLFRPFSRLMPVHYDNLAKIPRVGVPVLIIHGTEDELVPFSMGGALFEAAREPKHFYPIQGAGHNDTFVVGGHAYYQRLARFAADGR
jgi:fermentation-respiration switch protein FrsA (DUF1100 family)